MTNKKHSAASSEAHKALNTIQQMKRAAMRRATPPRWFGALIALLAGSLVSLSAADLRQYTVFIILLMVFVISYQSQKTGVSAKIFPFKTAVFGLIILVPLFFLLIIAAQLLQESLGHVSASLLCGGIFSVIVYLLSLFERRWYDKINSEKA
jgi:hypothetical protein|tara:strand:+ start:1833 stop:2288 length:456 start_codon:yes stop_codon:yes gene_type:complete